MAMAAYPTMKQANLQTLTVAVLWGLSALKESWRSSLPSTSTTAAYRNVPDEAALTAAAQKASSTEIDSHAPRRILQVGLEYSQQLAQMSALASERRAISSPSDAV